MPAITGGEVISHPRQRGVITIQERCDKLHHLASATYRQCGQHRERLFRLIDRGGVQDENDTTLVLPHIPLVDLPIQDRASPFQTPLMRRMALSCSLVGRGEKEPMAITFTKGTVTSPPGEAVCRSGPREVASLMLTDGFVESWRAGAASPRELTGGNAGCHEQTMNLIHVGILASSLLRPAFVTCRA